MANPVETKNLPKIIILAKETMLNLSGHEDDDCLIVRRPVAAQVTGPVRKEGLPVRVPEIGPDQTFFLHQPEVKEPGS